MHGIQNSCFYGFTAIARSNLLNLLNRSFSILCVVKPYMNIYLPFWRSWCGFTTHFGRKPHLILSIYLFRWTSFTTQKNCPSRNEEKGTRIEKHFSFIFLRFSKQLSVLDTHLECWTQIWSGISFLWFHVIFFFVSNLLRTRDQDANSWLLVTSSDSDPWTRRNSWITDRISTILEKPNCPWLVANTHRKRDTTQINKHVKHNRQWTGTVWGRAKWAKCSNLLFPSWHWTKCGQKCRLVSKCEKRTI